MRACAFQGDNMSSFKLAKPILVALAACAVNCAVGGAVLADSAQDNAQLKEQMRIMMQQMQEMQKQIQDLKQQQQQPQPAATAGRGARRHRRPSVGPEEKAKVAKAPRRAGVREVCQRILRHPGCLGRLRDQGHERIGRLSLVVRRSREPSHWDTCRAGPKIGPVGRVGWQADLSTNKSVLGYRGSHKIPDTTVDFIYQLEVQPRSLGARARAPATPRSPTSPRPASATAIRSSGLAQCRLGQTEVRNDVHAVQEIHRSHESLLGNARRLWRSSWAIPAATIASSSATRIDHSIWYESPKFGGLFSFDVLFSPGQNRTPYNDWPIVRLARLQRRQRTGQRQSAAGLRRRRLRQRLELRRQVRAWPDLLDGRLRNPPGREPRQRRHRLQQSRTTATSGPSTPPATASPPRRSSTGRATTRSRRSTRKPRRRDRRGC